ncbi:MAG: uroporphyrinogen-III synthase [Pseudomonadota bacterium]
MSGPLFGKRIVVTRSPDQAGELSELIRKAGAVPIEIPTIAFAPPADWSPVDRTIRMLSNYDLIVFTSRNAVRFFRDRLAAKGIERVPSSIRVAAVGTKTAEAAAELCDDLPLVPEHPMAAEELIDLLRDRFESLKGVRVLFPRAEKGREVLPEFLRKEKANVEVVTVYRTVPISEGKERLRGLMAVGMADWITFASGSAVDGFLALASRKTIQAWIGSKKIRIASIGRVTSKALEKHGFSVDAEPGTATIGAMVEAMSKVG